MKLLNQTILLAFALSLTFCSDNGGSDSQQGQSAKAVIFVGTSGGTLYAFDDKNPEDVTIIYNTTSLGHIAVDSTRSKIYLSEIEENKITKMDFNGEDPDVIYDEDDGLDMPWAMAVNEESGDLYWINYGTGTLMRGSVDGTLAPETLLNGQLVTRVQLALTLDMEYFEGALYFSNFDLLDPNLTGIFKVDLSTNQISKIYASFTTESGHAGFCGLSIDKENEKLIFTDDVSDKVYSITLNNPQAGSHAPLYDEVNYNSQLSIGYNKLSNQIYIPSNGWLQRLKVVENGTAEDLEQIIELSEIIDNNQGIKIIEVGYKEN